MKKKVIAMLLTVCMAASLLSGCGKEKTDSPKDNTTTDQAGSGSGSETETDNTDSAADGETYTYRTTYSGVSTWNPTDWQLEDEGKIYAYCISEFYGFWMNEAKDGYDIVCELATEFPVDLTAQYAGNETYGVPADATEGYAWQITMREDAAWEDGTPINVDDVEYALQQFLNPDMKNYRASSFYTGTLGLANAEAYYNNDQAGQTKLTLATDLGLAFSDFTAGDDGQYTDTNGNKAYFGWSVAINNDWVGGAALTDYTDYMTEETADALNALADERGYIPVTEESIAALYGFTGSDEWGNETEEDLVNYVFCEDGIAEEMPWGNVGFVRDGDYSFTLVLKNPCSLFDFEYNVDGLVLLNKELYEANKQEAGGLIKSSYGTAPEKFSSYGPYKVVTYQESKEVKMEKNENWYGYTDGNHEGMYQTTGIDMLQIDEQTTQISMFLQGNLDEVYLTSDDMEKYGTSDYVYFTPESYTYYLTFNTDFDMVKSRESAGVNKTIWTYLDFRKALSLALDRNDYVKSCTASSDPAYGLINDIYVCDPETGLKYRDCEFAKKTLCEVYNVDDVSALTGYDKEAASALLQSAYDQCYADGNISDADIVEIDYHIYGSDALYQKMVDFIEEALLAAAEGTSLEGRIQVNLIEDQDYYNSMKSGQDDLIQGSWGGADMNPYSIMQCYTDPEYIMEYGFDYTADLTVSVQGEEITMSFYDWYLELCTGTYATADLDVRNEILAGIEKGLLLNYHIIPLRSLCRANLASQRVIYGSEEFINSLVGRGDIQYMTYTMNDEEWDAYCKEQNNNLTY